MDYHADQVPIVQQANRVWCVYPISGGYTSLQRHLFWVVCAFVLFGHAHEWLTRAAIGFAASYSAAAAAHQVLLAFQAGPQHDADIFATDQVTQTSMLMLVAVALFCPGLVRRTPLVMVMGWVGLVFAAHLAGALVSARLWDGVSRSLVLSACRGDGPCDDPCGRMQVSTFFRGYGGDAMVPLRWDTVNVTYAATSLPPTPSLDDTVVVMPEKGPGWEVVRFMVKQALKVALPMAVAKVNAVHSPQEVRDKVFLRSLSRRQLRPHLLRAGWKVWTLWSFVWARQACWLLCTLVPAFAMIDLPLQVICFFLFHAFGFRIPEVDDVTYLEPYITWPRYQAGRYAGTAWYGLARVGYLTWFPVLLPQIIQAEAFLRTLPESESVRAVGQWSPWLAVTLALVAAILERMTEARSPPPPPDGGGDDGQARTDWLDAAYVRRACEDAASRAGRELAEAKGWWRRPEDALEAWMRASLAHDVSEEMLPRTMLSALGQVGELKRGRAAILPLTRVRGRRSWAVVVRGLHSAVRRAESWGRTTDAGGGESGSRSGSSGKTAKQD